MVVDALDIYYLAVRLMLAHLANENNVPQRSVSPLDYLRPHREPVQKAHWGFRNPLVVHAVPVSKSGVFSMMSGHDQRAVSSSKYLT
jgi:hypothetical protein